MVLTDDLTDRICNKLATQGGTVYDWSEYLGITEDDFDEWIKLGRHNLSSVNELDTYGIFVERVRLAMGMFDTEEVWKNTREDQYP